MSESTRHNLTIPIEFAGRRLDQALAELLSEYSRSRIKEWIEGGRVRVDGAQLRPKDKVLGGEQIELEAVLPSAEDVAAQPIDLVVVHEDKHVFVINKPAGLVVHPGAGNPAGTLQNALLHLDEKLAKLPRAGIVHRLDKDTTGLLVSAKTLEAQTDLVRQLQARSVKREYLALVHGRPQPESGVVDAAIGRHPVERTRMAVTAQGKPARTRYRVLENFDGASLLECSLDTGRTHQIRVHMQSIGHPLVGDPVYGQRNIRQGLLTSLPRQALHAARLGLVHPASGAAISWESPMPADFEQLLQALR